MPRPPQRPTLFPTRRSSDLKLGLGIRSGNDATSREESRFVAIDQARTQRYGELTMTVCANPAKRSGVPAPIRSEEHTSELQSHSDLVCRLLLEKKNTQDTRH